MTLTGDLFIGAERVASGGSLQAVNPATGERIEPTFSMATKAEADRACALADAAFPIYAATDRETRARFLETIADKIMALGDALLERGSLETGLPATPRLAGERARTVGQLRLFAKVVREGGWLGLRFDPAMPDRQPLPRVDLRLRRVPVGPVVVFGASNFPLAFSVAGGDTASALAAGCPVIVKGHSAHPGTSELVAGAIQAAVAECGLPEGVFSLLNGAGNEIGSALVSDPRVKAVGFTGSRSGGTALMTLAAARPEPIPVYAEMSAINPVLILPHALEEKGEALGTAYIGSLTLSAGQMCTNPGLVIAIEGPGLDAFLASAGEATRNAAASTMLSPGIHGAFGKGVAALENAPQVETIARGQAGTGPHQGQAALFAVPADAFDPHGDVAQEVFGAASVVIRCRDEAALVRVLGDIEGQLTATVHFTDGDRDQVARLLPLLERKAGRLIANGWPTGVEVGDAMVHGGPFPATSDGRTTSVGTLAIDRFLRPVSYQDFPDTLLPEELRGTGPDGVPRRIDGTLTI